MLRGGRRFCLSRNDGHCLVVGEDIGQHAGKHQCEGDPNSPIFMQPATRTVRVVVFMRVIFRMFCRWHFSPLFEYPITQLYVIKHTEQGWKWPFFPKSPTSRLRPSMAKVAAGLHASSEWLAAKRQRGCAHGMLHE
jgi:hypothetical protein